MERIKSFTINHDILMPGFYISRVDSDITTYDMPGPDDQIWAIICPNQI